MFRKVVFAFFLISILCVVTVYSRDVLSLKNGSIIKGEILEYVPNGSVKIKTSDGSIFVYEAKDVIKIVKDDKEPSVNNRSTSEEFGIKEEGVQPAPSTNKAKITLFLINPVTLIYQTTVNSITYFDFEWQLSLFKYLTLYVSPGFEFGNIYYYSYSYGYSVIPYTGILADVGVYFMPFGNSLDGLFIRAGVGIASVSISGYSANAFYGVATVGYQIVFKPGFVLHFGVGGLFSASSASVKLDIAKIGWAF